MEVERGEKVGSRKDRLGRREGGEETPLWSELYIHVYLTSHLWEEGVIISILQIQRLSIRKGK